MSNIVKIFEVETKDWTDYKFFAVPIDTTKEEFQEQLRKDGYRCAIKGEFFAERKKDLEVQYVKIEKSKAAYTGLWECPKCRKIVPHMLTLKICSFCLREDVDEILKAKQGV